MNTGLIFAVKHFAVHDGPGIRTTVFFKGCPLSCLWCHNPEGKSFTPQLAFYAHKCMACGACEAVCGQKVHRLANGQHILDRTKCVLCGQCADICPVEALTLFGKTVTVDALLPELTEDRDFFETSGGGVTLSGGECLMQSDFCAALLKALKQENIHCAVDTCGFVPRKALDRVMPYTDLFLYDIKAFSAETHLSCTGQTNELIWENLGYINEQNKPCEIRIPLVPGHNDAEAEAIARKLKGYACITGVKILPYHNFSGSKYAALAMDDTMPAVEPPDRLLLQNIVDIFLHQGVKASCDALE